VGGRKRGGCGRNQTSFTLIKFQKIRGWPVSVYRENFEFYHILMEVVFRELGEARVVTVVPTAQINSLGENIMWGGRSLNGDLTFADYGIHQGAELMDELA
jgi:hypothetical protein